MKNAIVGTESFQQEVSAQSIALVYLNRVLMQLYFNVHTKCFRSQVTELLFLVNEFFDCFSLARNEIVFP